MDILKKLFLAVFFGGICICAYAASENAMMDFDRDFLIISHANKTSVDSGLSLFEINLTDEGIIENRSAMMETQNLGLDLWEAGSDLRGYRLMHYGGILWGAISQIVSIGKTPSNSMVIGIPGTVLLVMADYNVWKAGERLEMASKSGSTGDIYLLGEAGRNLKKYRLVTHIGYAAAYAGQALALVGMADDNDALVLTGALLGSLIGPIIASAYIGAAGRDIQAVADDFPQYEHNLKEAGKNLVTHRNLSYSFFAYFGLGIGLLAVGELAPELSTPLGAAGSASIIIGIIQLLRAPWHVGVAGENLEMARK